MHETVFLRPDVHATAVGEDLVLLDVAADRYLCLRAACGGAALSPGRESLDIADPDLLAQLRGAGLLTTAAPGPSRPAAPPAAARSAIPAEVPPPGRREIGAAANAIADLLVRYRGRSFADVLAAGSTPRSAPPAFTADLEAAVLRFHAWAPYAPVPTKCLLRSFMLLRILRRQGLDALWVFGVRTWPFHAHCWLQVEDVVLDDPAERTWAYSPILVV
jgi:hypothetical protein